ncbi:MAG: LacI family DNA-binding transcriptional regulator [Clostridia bacterium]|nr:LacI family DNA-binding transcriptional regulator [Clostridia bacterium]MBN2883489.1 LacI family DNA-binding transcriptional regulator [Clostridia bacterium]
MPTIYDIAKVAGVSPATVSKVFNDYTDVSQKTKDKVMAVVAKMGYVPNLTAQSLKTNKSYLVGVMFSEDLGIGLEHQYFSVVLESFRKAIGAHGYDTVFINKTFGENEMGYLEHCKYRGVDGVFIITAQPDDIDVAKLLSSKIKCVTTDIRYKDTPLVASDNAGGSVQVVRYLYNMGHRRIAHIAGPRDTRAGRERFEGYIEGLKEVGLVYDPTYFAEVSWYDSQETYNLMKNFMRRFSPRNRPTAIYVGADIMAIGALQALESIGLSVPEDVSVVGFDDIQMAKFMSPALTTVFQNKELIGETVAHTLNKLMNNEKVDDYLPRIPVKMVERASVMKIDIE